MSAIDPTSAAVPLSPPGPSPAPAPALAGTFYDARRGIYYVKPVMRGWLHLLWFAASLVFGILL
ncbi:MAG TPA: hypothetical protein VN597_14790, partial [Streptosporangiaceae bacterium]|nr:hypothetical protein [Streptosporangiaceae bacterium]